MHCNMTFSSPFLTTMLWRLGQRGDANTGDISMSAPVARKGPMSETALPEEIVDLEFCVEAIRFDSDIDVYRPEEGVWVGPLRAWAEFIDSHTGSTSRT